MSAYMFSILKLNHIVLENLINEKLKTLTKHELYQHLMTKMLTYVNRDQQ